MILNDHFALNSFCDGMFGGLKHGFRSLATLKLILNVLGELKRKKNGCGGFLATARLSCVKFSHRTASYFLLVETRKHVTRYGTRKSNVYVAQVYRVGLRPRPTWARLVTAYTQITDSEKNRRCGDSNSI